MNSKYNINYIMPDFTCCSRNKFFLDLLKEYPNVLRNNTNFYSFYGIFAGAKWNGGGYLFGYEYVSPKKMKQIRDFYNKRGIVITFTFTNQLITEEHLHDEYCNQMLKIFHNGMNEVLVVSTVLEKYIKENYPKYKINRSIINTEKVPFLLDNYHLTVLSKFKNKDFDLLKSLSIEERSRTELLCDELCVNNCPYKYEHYKEYAYIQLHGKNPENAHKNFGKCRFTEEDYCYYRKRISDSKYIITYEDIVNTYMPLGFKYFKLSGRGRYNVLTLVKFMEYLIKEEYQMDVLTFLGEQMIMEYESDLFGELNSWVGTKRIDQVNFQYV